MSRAAALPLLLIAALGACRAPLSTAPSLAPRAAEAIDPRLPVVPSGTAQPADPALLARLQALVGQARSGEQAFGAALGEAQRLASAAGAPQSESWVVAQQALSAAVAARAPTTRALGDIDALASEAVALRGGLAPADLAAVQAAAAEVGAIDRRQAQQIDALVLRLRG
jgi:hypothetical protein